MVSYGLDPTVCEKEWLHGVRKGYTSISSNIKCCSLKRIKYVRIQSGFGWAALYYNVLIETFSLSLFVNIDVLSNHVNSHVLSNSSLLWSCVNKLFLQ